MMEAILLLATIAGRFQVHAVAGDPVEPVPSFTLRPKHGIRVALKERPGRTGSPLAQGDTTVATSALRQ
jgi:hypothetical protein